MLLVFLESRVGIVLISTSFVDSFRISVFFFLLVLGIVWLVLLLLLLL